MFAVSRSVPCSRRKRRAQRAALAHVQSTSAMATARPNSPQQANQHPSQGQVSQPQQGVSPQQLTDIGPLAGDPLEPASLHAEGMTDVSLEAAFLREDIEDFTRENPALADAALGELLDTLPEQKLTLSGEPRQVVPVSGQLVPDSSVALEDLGGLVAADLLPDVCEAAAGSSVRALHPFASYQIMS